MAKTNAKNEKANTSKKARTTRRKPLPQGQTAAEQVNPDPSQQQQPGAATSTEVGPKLLNETFLSSWSVAATAIILGRS